MQNTRVKHPLTISLTIIIIFVLRFLVLTRLDLFPDEAYYWDWSRFLSFGYFDHPPMVAWLVHLSTSILGDSYWGIKAAPLLMTLAVSIVMYLLAKYYLKSLSSFVLLIVLLNATLLYAAGGLLLTPDIPFLFFWALGLLVGHQALFTNRTLAWPLLGLVAGLGLLSKYVFFLFFAAFALFLLLDKNYRLLLLTWKPWCAFFLAAIIFLPNIVWNARHEWASYLFQFGHGLKSGKPWPQIGLFFEYIGGQIAMFSPFLFIVLIMAVVYYFKSFRQQSSLIYLFVFLATPLLFFSWTSLRTRVEVNWPAPAFLSALVLVMWYVEQVSDKPRLKKFIGFSMGFSILVTILLFSHAMFPFLPIPIRQDRTYDPRGWKLMAKEIDDIRAQYDPLKKKPLCANSYQLASLLAYHCEDVPRTWALNFNSRPNHYDYVEARTTIANDTLLFVCDLEDNGFPVHLHKFFAYEKMLSPVVRPLTETYADTFAVYQVVLSEKGQEEILPHMQQPALLSR